MKEPVTRLSSAVKVKRLCNGQPKLVETHQGYSYTFPEKAWPLVAALWSGLPKMGLLPMEKSDLGLLLAFGELGLLEEALLVRAEPLVVMDEPGQRANAAVVPWAHMLLAGWAVFVSLAIAPAFDVPHAANDATLNAWMLALAILIPPAWVALHEYAHLLSARQAGVRAGSVTFFQASRFAPRFHIGAGEEYVSIAARYRIYMAGPALNSVLASIILAASRLANSVVLTSMAFLAIGFTCLCFFAMPGMDTERAMTYARKSWPTQTSFRFMYMGYVVAVLMLAASLVRAVIAFAVSVVSG